MLTIKDLKKTKPEEIFASGQCWVSELNGAAKIQWVAVKGELWSWEIRWGQTRFDKQYTRDFGFKCFNEKVIRKLVPCDDQALRAYSYS